MGEVALAAGGSGEPRSGLGDVTVVGVRLQRWLNAAEHGLDQKREFAPLLLGHAEIGVEIEERDLAHLSADPFAAPEGNSADARGARAADRITAVAVFALSEIHTMILAFLTVAPWSFRQLATKVRVCFTVAQLAIASAKTRSVCRTGNGRAKMSSATCGVLSARTVAVSGRATEAPPPCAVLGRHTHRALDFGRDTVATSS